MTRIDGESSFTTFLDSFYSAVFIKNETETISLVRGFRLQSRRSMDNFPYCFEANVFPGCPIDATINFSRAILPNGTFSTDEGIMLHINSTECELDIVSTNIAHNFEVSYTYTFSEAHVLKENGEKSHQLFISANNDSFSKFLSNSTNSTESHRICS